jgi:predicted small lipoprotein YifL
MRMRRAGLGRWSIVALALLALAPAACGKKGPPQLPPPQTDEFPQDYPKSTEPQQGIFN